MKKLIIFSFLLTLNACGSYRLEPTGKHVIFLDEKPTRCRYIDHFYATSSEQGAKNALRNMTGEAGGTHVHITTISRYPGWFSDDYEYQGDGYKCR